MSEQQVVFEGFATGEYTEYGFMPFFSENEFYELLKANWNRPMRITVEFLDTDAAAEDSNAAPPSGSAASAEG